MSFIVSQRTRDIGIRMALGADPRRILTAVFARAKEKIGVLLTVGLLIIGAGFVACIAPARRGLRIQPTEALRET